MRPRRLAFHATVRRHFNVIWSDFPCSRASPGNRTPGQSWAKQIRFCPSGTRHTGVIWNSLFRQPGKSPAYTVAVQLTPIGMQQQQHLYRPNPGTRHSFLPLLFPRSSLSELLFYLFFKSPTSRQQNHSLDSLAIMAVSVCITIYKQKSVQITPKKETYKPWQRIKQDG